MSGNQQRVHMADLARFIGWGFQQTYPHEVPFTSEISAVQNSGLYMIVGLNVVEMTVPVGEIVQLWRPADKIAHLRCGFRCNPQVVHKTTPVPAERLNEYAGHLAFLNGGIGPGPHLVIGCEVDGDKVKVTMSSSELVGPIDTSVEVAPLRSQ